MASNPFPHLVERSETGPFIREKDFDLHLARQVAALVRRHGLVYNPDVLVPADDDMADRLYQAGLELFVQVGVYNLSTERRLLFTREEVEEAVQHAPSSIVLGTGRDAVEERHRNVEDSRPCIMISGPTGTPTSERCHPLILQSCAQEPLIQGVGSGSVATYMGRRIVPGSPTEILASRRDATVEREAVKAAGRPGMHIHDVSCPLTCAGKMAAIDPECGIRPSDALLVSQLPELKTDYDQLSRAAYQQRAGVHIVDLMTPLVGGLGGGAPGTAVVTVASHIMGVLCYQVSHHYMGHMSLQWSHNTDRMGLWIQAMAGQALARNTPLISLNDIYPRSGLGCETLLWEVAAGAVVGAVCGLNQHGVGCTGGTRSDQTSGLEARFQAEVAHASLGLTRNAANEIVCDMVRRYEGELPNPDPGKPFPEVYNEDTVEPKEEWLAIYHHVRDALRPYGLNLDLSGKRASHGDNR